MELKYVKPCEKNSIWKKNERIYDDKKYKRGKELLYSEFKKDDMVKVVYVEEEYGLLNGAIAVFVKLNRDSNVVLKYKGKILTIPYDDIVLDKIDFFSR